MVKVGAVIPVYIYIYIIIDVCKSLVIIIYRWPSLYIEMLNIMKALKCKPSAQYYTRRAPPCLAHIYISTCTLRMDVILSERGIYAKEKTEA